MGAIVAHQAREASRPSLRLLAIALLLAVAALASVGGSIWLHGQATAGIASEPWMIVAGAAVAGLALVLAWGVWRTREWARSALVGILVLSLVCVAIIIVFDVFSEIFAGERVLPLADIGRALLRGAWDAVKMAGMPVLVLYLLKKSDGDFAASAAQVRFVDRTMNYVLLAAAFSAVIVVLLIIVFTMMESLEAIRVIGLRELLTGLVWRPNSGQYGLVPMMVGSVLSTMGAVLLGVPLSLLAAILLAEVAPTRVRDVLRPLIELLAGIPSVVYGLFGMVVLRGLIAKIDVSGNTGFGLLNASVVLAVMILPTVATVAEDALRAVPRAYKEGALALGSTHWETIIRVLLPAARSGIIAAVILGIGRALGETMALIMVIGNAISLPEPLNDNPLTLFMDTARTLTGNIAVEINYAAGEHRSALFFTGVLLFIMILLTNTLARYLMRERKAT